MAPRILAIGHDAYRAGAQIVLLHLLRWLRDHHDADLSLLLVGDGELVDDYAAVLPTRVLQPSAVSSTPSAALRRTVRRVLRRPPTRPEPARVADVGRGDVDLIYANSVATLPLATSLAADLRCPVVGHVHELEMSILRFGHGARLRAAMPAVDRFVAVSGAVEANLVARHGVDPARIERIPPCIPLPVLPPADGVVDARRASLGIPPDAFVVGGSGTLDWRKAPDVFLLVAKELCRRGGPPVHFVWVGGEANELAPVLHDVERLGLRGVAHFVGAHADPVPYFGLFDAFLLSSREDPFPLVCLEAAAMATPIVCFADAGGMPELVEDDAGYVVPYLDVTAAADRLSTLARDEPTRRARGDRAAEKVARQCSVDVVGPQIAAVLDACLR